LLSSMIADKPDIGFASLWKSAARLRQSTPHGHRLSYPSRQGVGDLYEEQVPDTMSSVGMYS
jgi:hypothetical protein